MELIGMCRVVFRREDRGEGGAGRIAGPAQEGSLFVIALPVSQQADPLTVLGNESRDIQRIASGMFAPLPVIAATDPAAIVGSQVLDAGNPRAEDCFGCRLHAMFHPDGISGCGKAGHLRVGRAEPFA